SRVRTLSLRLEADRLRARGSRGRAAVGRQRGRAGRAGQVGREPHKPAPRYDLVDRGGGPPSVGSVVELDGQGKWVVNRISQSPLPQDRRPCAYLLPGASEG